MDFWLFSKCFLIEGDNLWKNSMLLTKWRFKHSYFEFLWKGKACSLTRGEQRAEHKGWMVTRLKGARDYFCLFLAASKYSLMAAGPFLAMLRGGCRSGLPSRALELHHQVQSRRRNWPKFGGSEVRRFPLSQSIWSCRRSQIVAGRLVSWL